MPWLPCRPLPITRVYIAAVPTWHRPLTCKRHRHCHCVICHNTVFGSKRSVICAQAVYFRHSTMPSVTCMRLSDVSVICRVIYSQFPIQDCFSSTLVRLAAQRFTQYRTLGVSENLGRYLSCTRHYSKIAKCGITQTTPYDSPGTVVFGCQRSRRNSYGVTPKGGAK